MKKLAVLLAAFFAVANAAFSPNAAAAQQVLPIVKVAVVPFGLFLPLYYVPKIAEKHGIQVKLVEFRRGLEAAQALRAGQVDIGTGGIESGVSGAAGGAPAVIVSGLATGGIAWIGRSDMKWNSIADLKGKKFASIRGIHDLMMRAEFDAHGLSQSQEPGKADVQVVYINSGPGLNNALKTREVDAMTNAEPLASRAVVEGFGVPILRPYDTALGTVPRAVFAHRDFLKKRSDVAQRYISAVVEATKILRDNPKLAREFAVNDAFKNNITAEDWDLAVKNQKFDVDLTLDQVQRYTDAMLKYGMIHSPLKAADFTDLSMLEKAKKAIGW